MGYALAKAVKNLPGLPEGPDLTNVEEITSGLQIVGRTGHGQLPPPGRSIDHQDRVPAHLLRKRVRFGASWIGGVGDGAQN